MNRHGDDAPSAGAERPDAAGLPVRRRVDVDGCGCLHCRGISVPALHRSLFDTVRWSVEFCRRHPSTLVLALTLVAASEALSRLEPAYLPTAATGTLRGAVALGIFLGLRAYVATLVASELTDGGETTRSRWGRAVGRSLALVFVVLLTLGFVAVLWSVVELAVLAAVVFAAPNVVQTVGVVPVFVATGLLFLLPIILVLLGCWFALEASIIGRYGPLASIRVSAAVTRSYWDKLLRVVGGITLGIALGYVGSMTPQRLPVVGPLGPVFDVVGVAVGAVSVVVWFAVSAHLYVQAVATERPRSS